VIETLFTHCSHPAFGERVGLGDRTGVRIASMSLALNTSSKDAVNVVSRSRMRKRNRRPASSSPR